MVKRALATLCAVLLFVTGTVQADPLQSVAKQLSKGLRSLKPKRIAVLSFPYHNGDMSSGSSIVSERLTTLMVERGAAEVVERALLDKTMEEIRLGMTGVLDPATSRKLGKVLGVTAIVTGTLIDLEDRVTEVNARLIETETGKILAAGSSRIERTWEDLPKPPRPSEASRQDTHDEDYHVMMSKAIPNSSPPRRGAPQAYAVAMPPALAESAAPSDGDVLSLTNDDLIPVNHRGQTDPERILNDYLSNDEPPPANALRIARRIYHRNPSPQVRARALLAMGHILERNGHPGQAGQAYAQILREFSDSPALQAEARQHLEHVASR